MDVLVRPDDAGDHGHWGVLDVPTRLAAVAVITCGIRSPISSNGSANAKQNREEGGTSDPLDLSAALARFRHHGLSHLDRWATLGFDRRRPHLALFAASQVERTGDLVPYAWQGP